MPEFNEKEQGQETNEQKPQGQGQEQSSQTNSTGSYRPIGVEDTDLSGMDWQAAQAYVLAFIRTLKETQLQLTRLKEEAALWESRIKLAEQQNRPDLKAAAEIKKSELDSKMAVLGLEEQDLVTKIGVLKENLKKLKGQFQYSVDAEQLLAEMEMIVGEPDTLSAKFREESAQSELEKLKAKMQQEKNG
jgi:hypothetical protein